MWQLGGCPHPAAAAESLELWSKILPVILERAGKKPRYLLSSDMSLLVIRINGSTSLFGIINKTLNPPSEGGSRTAL